MADTPGGGTTTAFTPGADGSDTYTATGIGQLAATGNGNDTVDSKYDDTTVTGGSGNKLVALDGYDSVALGNGNDTIVFSAGAGLTPGLYETVSVGNGNDLINGINGYSDITLGNGSSTVYTSGQDNIIHDGSGSVTSYLYSYENNSGVTIVGGNGSLFVGLGGQFDSVSVGSSNDTIVGSQGDASISAGNGNDLITAYGSDNFILAGNGNDTILTGAQNDVSGGSGASTVVAGSGSNDITLVGEGNQASLTGGTDTVTVGGDSVAGTGGSDTISISGTSLSIAGAQGTSTFVSVTGGNSAIIDNATGTQVSLAPTFGNLTFDPSHDSSWVFDLNSANGITNSTDPNDPTNLANHLSYDPNTQNTTLSLANGTSVIFEKADVTADSGHFKIT